MIRKVNLNSFQVLYQMYYEIPNQVRNDIAMRFPQVNYH